MRLAAFAGVGLAAALVAGCSSGGGGTATPSSGSPTSSAARTATIPPAGSPTPSTSGEQAQAYAAATKAYQSFVQVLDQVRRDSGNKPERLRKVSTDLALRQSLAIAQGYKVSGRRLVGSTSFVYVRPQRLVTADQSTSGAAEVTLKSCEAPGAVYAVDRNGKRIKPRSDADKSILYTVTVRRLTGPVGDDWAVSALKTDLVTTCQ